MNIQSDQPLLCDKRKFLTHCRKKTHRDPMSGMYAVEYTSLIVQSVTKLKWNYWS